MRNLQPIMSADSSADIIELLEIAQALARAETALLMSDASKAIDELQDLQQRATVLLARLRTRPANDDARAA
jgi:hypothetical protein